MLTADLPPLVWEKPLSPHVIAGPALIDFCSSRPPVSTGKPFAYNMGSYKGEHGTCDKDMKMGRTMDKILFIWRWQRQGRDTSHQKRDSRMSKVDLPLVHHNKTGYITAKHLVSSSKAGKSCRETAALSRQTHFVPVQWSGLNGTWSQCTNPTFLAAQGQQKQQAETSLFSLLHDLPTRVRSPAVCSFISAYTFISLAAWATLGPVWQLLSPHFSSHEAPLT